MVGGTKTPGWSVLLVILSAVAGVAETRLVIGLSTLSPVLDTFPWKA